MNTLIKTLLLSVIIIAVVSCNDASTKEIPKQVTKKTQALLLTQPFEFDPSDKEKVTGDYVAQTKIMVPSNLATQSKWIMFEGPVLENDKIAYRFYVDTRHRFDIYAKSVPDLVMDTVSWNYHDIMNWGSDVLKVGNSLGIGSPAIWYQDSLYTLSKSDKKEVEVLENGLNKSTIRTTFIGLEFGNQKIDLIQDWSIQAGNHHSTIRLEVLNGKLPNNAYFATGIVKHLDDVKTGQSNSNFYAYTWGEQSFHHEKLGMGVFANQKYQPEMIADNLSHTYIFKNAPTSVVYAFLAGWERGSQPIKEEMEFKKIVEEACH